MTERQKVLVLIFQVRKLRPRERGKGEELPPPPTYIRSQSCPLVWSLLVHCPVCADLAI